MKYLIPVLMFSLMNCTTESDQVLQTELRLPSDTAHVGIIRPHVKGMYTVVVTNDVQSTQQFYTKWFGYSIVFESSWFVLLASPGENSSMIAFMDEVHPSSPPAPKPMKGDGMFLTIDVADAKSVYEALTKAGANIIYQLKEEPWGQRRFALKDPSGVWIDVVEQIQPEGGWWDQYMVKSK